MGTGSTRDGLFSLFRDVVLPLADAYQATRRHLRWDADAEALVVDGLEYPLTTLGRVYLVGAGKAGVPMARAVVDVLDADTRLRAHFAGGVVNVYREQAREHIPGVTLFAADHPTPNEFSVEGARAAVQLLARATADDLVLAVISGGGSSLLTLPEEGLSLEDLRDANKTLVTGGLSIQEINTVRKHLCRVKGGGLRMAAPAARFATLVLSDVIGDDLSSIASGPTVRDATTCADALALLESSALLERMPAPARACLTRAPADETQQAALWSEMELRSQTIVVASNAVVLEALAHRLASDPMRAPGLNVVLEQQPVTSTVAAAVPEHLRRAEVLRAVRGAPLILLLGGEPVVTVPASATGTGGRMLHYAAMCAREIEGTGWTVLASGSDGIDGTAPAAGAVVDGLTVQTAKSVGLQVDRFIDAFDSYGFFRELEARTGERFLNVTGPTGTNVNDIMLWSHDT